MIGTINCVYETPCGWCSKWDKKCDKKIAGRGKRVKCKVVDDAIDDSTKEYAQSILSNKICTSEEDHEWECCGISTAGSDYRCKKCGAHKTIPVNYQPLQPFYDSPAFDHIPNCCKACPNHPSNGGSGICNCTAPYFEQGVTCTNTVQTSNVTKLDY